jgi:16S rRNA C967 or C1407 C5-methylase (RsmB/RsmF family)
MSGTKSSGIKSSTGSNLLLKLARKLFTDAEQQAQFVHALTHPQSYPPSILWLRSPASPPEFTTLSPLPWQPPFVDRLPLESKPGRSPLHEAGYFYCLDFSSVFAASALLTISKPVNLVFDMCASPGGKSLFAWVALQPQQLICNEVIGKRKGALLSNLKRCQVEGAIALNRDSSVLADLLPQVADVVLVDAPCTGQSLLAKGGKAPGCFHPVSINKNASRQKRIVANSAQIVAPQGYLLYMTCAYSIEENEDVCTWLLQRFPQFQPVVVETLQAYRSHLIDLPCYRMFPQSGLGAGAFAMLLQNTDVGERRAIAPETWAQIQPNVVL